MRKISCAESGLISLIFGRSRPIIFNITGFTYSLKLFSMYLYLIHIHYVRYQSSEIKMYSSKNVCKRPNLYRRANLQTKKIHEILIATGRRISTSYSSLIHQPPNNSAFYITEFTCTHMEHKQQCFED